MPKKNKGEITPTKDRQIDNIDDDLNNESSIEELNKELEKDIPNLSDSVQIYLKAIGKLEPLTAEEEIQLSRQVHSAECETSKKQYCNQLVRANLRLVVSIARKYSYRVSVPLLDLVQEGNTGLIRASEKFEASYGCRFATYAAHWIKQSIIKTINQRKRPFKLPQHIQDKLNKVNKIVDQLSAEYQRAPSNEEIAQSLKQLNDTSSQDDITLLRALNSESISLDSYIGTDTESTVGDTISDDEDKVPESQLKRKSLYEELNKALKLHLSENEQDIIKLRYGINTQEYFYSVDEVSKKLDITRDKVRRTEFKALRQLKNNVSQDLKDYLL